jgi:hypothetical protein
MTDMVKKLDPFRWKVFQVLVVTGENESDKRKRDATKFIVTDEQYEDFCSRHRHLKCMIPEPNKVMKSSYLVSSLLHHVAFEIMLIMTSLLMSTCAFSTREMAMRRYQNLSWKLVYRKPSSRFGGTRKNSAIGEASIIGVAQLRRHRVVEVKRVRS